MSTVVSNSWGGWSPSAGVEARLEAMLARLDEHLLDVAAVRAGDGVLDIGCGTGSTSLAAATRVGPAGRVVGIDADPDAIAVARERVQAAGLAQAMFVRGDPARHGFLEGACDAVLSRCGTLAFADPVATHARLRAALVPGGRLAALLWCDRDRPVEPGIVPAITPASIPVILGLAGFVDPRVQPLDLPGLGESAARETGGVVGVWSITARAPAA